MRLKHLLVPLLAAAVGGATLAVVRAGTASADADSSAAPLSVMTRNVDLGSDLGPVLAATDGASFVHGVSVVWNEIAASGIPERADGIAAEIGQTMPMVVSLQEVSLIQRLDGSTVVDELDQLADIRAALAARGLHYDLAVDAHEFDVTVPSDTGKLVRLLDQNVILTRADLPARQFSVTNAQHGDYATVLMLPTPIGAVPGSRGWASVDVTRMGRTVRVIDTHLEDLSAAIGGAQAAELLAGPASTNLPVVVAADINSGPGYTTDAYDTLTAALTDTWTVTKPRDPGMTWALHGEDGLPLRTTPSRRIDVVLTRGLVPVTDVLIGADDRTLSGFYPSDHAGVVARLAPAS
jgi:endonuclease/exonuclease/phosphatase family metal-dependent hydrolase